MGQLYSSFSFAVDIAKAVENLSHQSFLFQSIEEYLQELKNFHLNLQQWGVLYFLSMWNI